MLALLCAHIDANKLVPRRSGLRLTARKQVRARPAHSVLEDVGKEGSQEQGDDEAEDADVNLMSGGPCDGKVENQEEEGE